MKVVCAYCTVVIRKGAKEPVSHGICPSCLASELRKLEAEGDGREPEESQ